MKKRSAKRRQARSRKLLGKFGEKATRSRRPWTFEQLEERCYFAASTTAGLGDLQWFSLSNSTQEGQQAIRALEQMWYAQSSGMSGATHAAPMSLPLPTDPYFNYQWHLLNVGQVVNPGQFQDLHGVPGQDINVIPAWDMFDSQGRPINGQGVFVAVVDDGVQLSHPDLIANLATQYGWDALRNRPGGGVTGDNGHGTAVAGLIGASRDNGEGGVGVAPGAALIPIRFLGSSATTESPFINAITAGGAPIDIYNHSWGPAFDFYGRSVAGPTEEEFVVLTNSVLFGRNGLGAIHVFASGNSSGALHSAGSNGYVNSRYTIGVGMVDHDGQVRNSDGTITKYGEVAPSVLIVAPSASGPTDIINNFNTGSGIFTTDLLGDQGYNLPPLPNGTDVDIDTFPDPDYTTRFGGTSAAAPLVSGVIALMLQANPNLSYRDVQEILVRSARQNNDVDESWITNLVPVFREPTTFGDFPGFPGVSDIPRYRLEHGVIITPAVQASTGQVVATNTSFSITAVPDEMWDGEIANHLKVVFRFEEGDVPGAVAEIATPTRIQSSLGFASPMVPELRITVTGQGVTWGDIDQAIDDMGGFFGGGWFDMAVSDPLALFDMEDLKITALFQGGAEATGYGTDAAPSQLVRHPLYQFYHPLADPITNPEPPALFTNGAGFTVSHGRGGSSEYGWAHGVVNAELAVQLAQQWHVKNQQPGAEKTYVMGRAGIQIQQARRPDPAGDERPWVIPGALSVSDEDFGAYFLEFLKEPTFEAGDPGDPAATPPTPPTPGRITPDSMPFGQNNPPRNTRGGYAVFNVPAIDPVTGGSNLIGMEWVEVQLTVTGDANAMDFLRITLVSPDGTHSELTQNQYLGSDVRNNFQSIATGGVFGDPAGAITNLDENGNPTNTLSWVYSTNRIWGERSDSKPLFDEYATFDPLFNEWVPTFQGDQIFAGSFFNTKGWELHFENYSATDLQLGGVSIAFHGRPLGSTSDPIERVMGKVGVDSGRFIPSLGQIVGANDAKFNFDRFVSVDSTSSANFTTPSFGGFSETPFGNHEVRIADTTQESFAGNITVYAIDNLSGQRVAQFVTGYDGNYYFDLPSNDVQATTGLVAAENTSFTVRATKNGGFGAEKGNGVTVNFIIDDTVAVASAQLIGSDLFVRVRDETVPWSAIDSAIESITRRVLSNGERVTVPVFNVIVEDPSATFAAADANIVATLSGGIAGTYTIGIEDPLGRNALANGRNYDSEWIIRIDTTDAFTREAAEIDPITGKIRYFNDLNFLLDPGSLPVGEVVFTGSVIADLNGDGVQDPNELGVGDFLVFADLNHSRLFELGEPFAFTDADGNYTLNIPTATPNTFSLSVQPPAGWNITNPALGFHHVYARPGDVVDGKTFLVDPPDSPTGVGNATVFGFIFNDRNGDGIRQSSTEGGAANITVFIDANQNGELDSGEISTKTTSTGAYTFYNVSPGSYRIDVVANEPYVLTAPAAGHRDVTLTAGQVVQDVNFGMQNLATHDFGDLFGEGFHTYGPNAARNFVVPGFQLGSRIDGEVRSRVMVETAPGSGEFVPTFLRHGIGDDQDLNDANFDDEDGVILVGGVLRPGANTLMVTVHGVGGYLQGWIDFNNNGTFDPSERIFHNVDINPGTYQFLVTAPEWIQDGEVAARFRWGTGDIDFFGPDIIGEVEDYLFVVDTSPPPPPPGDFNGDLAVDGLDYDLWRATYGSTTDLRADANANTVTDAADYVLWRKYATNAQPSGSGAEATAATTDENFVSSDSSDGDSSNQPLQFSPEESQAHEAGAAAGIAAWSDGAGTEGFNVGGPHIPVTPYAYHLAVATPLVESDSASGHALSLAERISSQAPPFVFGLFDAGVSASLNAVAGTPISSNSKLRGDDLMDAALLLLATDARASSDRRSEDPDREYEELSEIRSQHEDMELELSAVFAEDTDWRPVL